MCRSLAISLGIVVAACGNRAPTEKVDPALVTISEDVVVLTSDVGHDQWERPATYVIVDATNTAESDLFVTLGGTLTGADGEPVGELRPESLRMPAGSKRMFLLVDHKDSARPAAVGADLVVKGAVVPTWGLTAHLDEGHLHHDQDRAIVSANLTNDAKRPGKLLVFGAFHDAAGKPMQRQYSLAEIGPGITQVVRFVGPPGSKKGVIFLGDSSY